MRMDDIIWKIRPQKVVALGGRTGPRALFSYLNRPLAWSEDDPRFRTHSNQWESWEIAHQLVSRGYAVDGINFDDRSFTPVGEYEVFFDIHGNMQRLAGQLGGATKLLHITGSYPRFGNAAEKQWASEFEERTGVTYQPKRVVKDLDEFDRSMRIADRCSLIGNEITLRSFPEDVRDKMTTVTVSASLGYSKKPSGFIPSQREFVWFFGSGAVHKGLDRTLEAFRRMNGRVLNVVGNVGWEEDFMEAYGPLLRGGGNIRYHGHLDPTGERFREIVDRSIAFIAPSCSEGISPAVATMLQAGLYPIISRETGVTLPTGHGLYLPTCSIDEIRQACENAASMSDATLIESITTCQNKALEAYSREAFRRDMRGYLQRSLAENQ
jgi:glycosyltransferase involved in cell wall biosynthesis